MNSRLQLLQAWQKYRIFYRQCTTKLEKMPAAVRISTPGPPPSVSRTNDNENNNVVVTGLDDLLRDQESTKIEEYRKSVSFDDVPGPAVFKYIAKGWSYLPMLSNQVTVNTAQYLLSAGSQVRWRDNMFLFKYLVDNYGPIVRLHGFGLLLSRPEHAAVVFENEGPYPVRSSLDSLEKYRLEHRHYKQAGPFVMYGPEWGRLRKMMETSMKGTDGQRMKIENVSDELIDRILFIRNRQYETPRTFYSELHKWSVECLFSVAFHKRLGCLDLQGLSSVSEPNLLLQGLTDATDAIRRCEFGLRLWRFVQTPAWNKLVGSLGEIEAILDRHVRQVHEVILARQKGRPVDLKSLLDLPTGMKDPSIVECLLLGDAMLQEDVITVLLDMLIIGVNLTAHSLTFVLYHIARNPRVQRKLYNEISDTTDITPVHRRPYLRACIRESLRLKPPMPVLRRVTTKDLSVHGYQIPRGTQLLIATHLSSVSDEFYDDAARFRPERWLGDNTMDSEPNALASIPFGRGPKACVAQELAQMQIGVLLAKMLQRFRLEYHYGDICASNRVLSVPDRPLQFRFVDRD